MDQIFSPCVMGKATTAEVDKGEKKLLAGLARVHGLGDINGVVTWMDIYFPPYMKLRKTYWIVSLMNPELVECNKCKFLHIQKCKRIDAAWRICLNSKKFIPKKLLCQTFGCGEPVRGWNFSSPRPKLQCNLWYRPCCFLPICLVWSNSNWAGTCPKYVTVLPQTLGLKNRINCQLPVYF